MDVWLIAWGSICHMYMCMLWYVKGIGCNGMCILLYVKLIGCNGFPWIYAQLGWVSVCHRYMCILLYVKIMQCHGFQSIYARLWSAKWCYGLPEIHAQLTRGVYWGAIAYKRPNNNSSNNNIQINLHILFNICVIMSCLIIVVTV